MSSAGKFLDMVTRSPASFASGGYTGTIGAAGGQAGAIDPDQIVHRCLPGEPTVEEAVRKPHVQALAFEIADESARIEIESRCSGSVSGPHVWFDTRSCEVADCRLVDRALAYIESRSAALAGYRMVRSVARPFLVRFEEVPQ